MSRSSSSPSTAEVTAVVADGMVVSAAVAVAGVVSRAMDTVPSSFAVGGGSTGTGSAGWTMIAGLSEMTAGREGGAGHITSSTALKRRIRKLVPTTAYLAYSKTSYDRNNKANVFDSFKLDKVVLSTKDSPEYAGQKILSYGAGQET